MTASHDTQLPRRQAAHQAAHPATDSAGGEDVRTGPLQGIRVLDLSNLMAGPMAAMFLADFGADVIKVEHPTTGDEFRRWGHHKGDVGLFFKVINRNKKTITLNLKSAKGQDLVRRLVPSMDVVVENYRPGTLERWGIGYEALSQLNPGLIMARVTGFGQTGPYAQQRGFGTIGEALSGLAYATGFPDRPPLLPASGLGDASTALLGAYAILLALFARDRSPEHRGQSIDLALYEALFTLMGPPVIDYDQLGLIQERGSSFVAPRNTYQTADGIWVAIAGSTQSTFEHLAQALEAPALLDDVRFATNSQRLVHHEALDALIQERVGRLPFAALRQRCEEAGVPMGPAYNIAQIFADPHYAARENIAAVADDELGTVHMQNVIPRLAATPGAIRHAGLPKGRCNREIYGDWLGLSADEMEALRREGVI